MTLPPPVVATTPIPGEHCELCGKGPEHGVILIQMMPGPDSQPWALCVADYNEGRKPFKVGLIPAAYKDDSAPRRKAG